MHTVCIGGIEVRLTGALDAPHPYVVFAAHGRLQDATSLDDLCGAVAAACARARAPVVVASFDQRNHGARIADAAANGGWAEHDDHPLDMYAVQWGTACDIRHLADVLPAKLGIRPRGFGVAGVSLGGHTTLLVLAHDARFDLGVSIIGCGDFATLMAHRARAHDVALDSAAFWTRFLDALTSLVRRVDPIHHADAFAHKALLVLGGARDTLVPPACNADFVDRVRRAQEAAGDGARKGELVETVFANVGHRLAPEMVEATARWFAERIAAGAETRASL